MCTAFLLIWQAKTLELSIVVKDSERFITFLGQQIISQNLFDLNNLPNDNELVNKFLNSKVVTNNNG